MYKAALVGTGGIARAHVAAVEAFPERIELVAAVDIDNEKVQEFCTDHNIPKAFTDLHAMLDEVKPDLVLLCTPPSIHAEQAIACMEAGAWVYCEKPLCASLAELQQIMEAEDRTGKYTASVFQQRFGSAATHLKQLIDNNTLGKPLVAVCNTLWYRNEDYYAVPWRGKWETETGGTTMTHGIHSFDLALFLLGEWQEVRAMFGTLDRDIEVDDVTMALVKMKNGAMLNITNSALSPRQETYLRFDFQQATVEATYLYRHHNEHWNYTILDGHGDLETHATIPTDIPAGHTPQLGTILDSMDQNVRPPVSGDDVQFTLEFATALYKSAFTGQPVQRGSIQPGDPYYEAMSGRVKNGV